MLETDPKVYARVHGPSRHLFVDEYQDVNPAQERLIELLSRPTRSSSASSATTTSRSTSGAAPTSRTSSASRARHDGVTTAVLDTNRRSPPAIVDAAEPFRRSPSPAPRRRRWSRADPPARSRSSPWKAETTEDEAERIADTIERLRAEGLRLPRHRRPLPLRPHLGPPLIDGARDSATSRSPAAGRTGLFLQPERGALRRDLRLVHRRRLERRERTAQRRKVDLDAVVAGLDRPFGGGRPIPGLKRYLEDWKSFRLAAIAPVNLVGDFYRLLAVPRRRPHRPRHAGGLGPLRCARPLLAGPRRLRARPPARPVRRGERRPRVPRGAGPREALPPVARELPLPLRLRRLRGVRGRAGGRPRRRRRSSPSTRRRGSSGRSSSCRRWSRRRFPSRRAGTAAGLAACPMRSSRRRRERATRAARRRSGASSTSRMTRARDCRLPLLLRAEDERRSSRRRSCSRSAGGRSRSARTSRCRSRPSARRAPEPPPLDSRFSDLALLDDCGYRYRLGSGLRLRAGAGAGARLRQGDPPRAAAAGRAVARATGKVPTARELDGSSRSEFYLPFANKPAFEQMKNARRRGSCSATSTSTADDLGRIWATERPFELHLEGGIVSGRADVILDEEGGEHGLARHRRLQGRHRRAPQEIFELQLRIYAAAGIGRGPRRACGLPARAQGRIQIPGLCGRGGVVERQGPRQWSGGPSAGGTYPATPSPSPVAPVAGRPSARIRRAAGA